MNARERSATKALVRTLAAVALTLAVAGCGGGAKSAGPVPTVTTDSGPETASAAAAAPPTGSGPYVPYVVRQPLFQLWFIGAGGPGPLQYVWRTAEELDIPYTLDEVGLRPALGVPRMLELLVEGLRAGPSDDERAGGFEDGPWDVRLLGISLDPLGVATVNLDADPALWRYVRPYGVAMIVFTLSQFPEVEGVKFEHDGRPVRVPVWVEFDPGDLVDRPVTPADYVGALPSQSPEPAAPPDTSSCDPSYGGSCVPVVSYDLACGDIAGTVEVIGSDPHNFDSDGDGYGCESDG